MSESNSPTGEQERGSSADEALGGLVVAGELDKAAPELIFNPDLVEWVEDTTGQPVAVITQDKLYAFAAKVRPHVKQGGNLGINLSNRLVRAGLRIRKMEAYVYYGPGRKSSIGLRADTFGEMLEGIKSGELNIGDMGPKTIKFMEQCLEELYIQPNPQE